MSLGRFLAVLRARWWVAVSVPVVIVALTLLVCLLLPKQYTATASVYVDAKPDPLTAMTLGAGLAGPSLLATQIDIIQSDRVAQRVVRNLKLNENPQVREQWQEATGGVGSIEAWLGTVFQKSLDVTPSTSTGSNIVMLAYRAPDPNFASALVNAFVQAYIETSLELRVDPARQYSTFFESRSKDAREALEKAQSRLSQFQKEKGIIATDERLDVENQRLNELSSQLVAVQAMASDTASRQAQATGGAGDRMQEVLNNGVVAGLKADMARAEARLQELNARLGVNHPQVIEAKASLAELRVRHDAEVRRVMGSVGVANNVNKQRESELRAALDSQRNKMLQMKALRDEGAVLVRDAESAQRAYDAVLARLTSSSLESQSTQSNVYPLSQATPPTESSFPRVTLSALVALSVGVLLAAVAVLLLEMLDRRVRVPEDIPETLGLPVIGVIPKPAARRLFRRTAGLRMESRLLQLPGKGKAA